MYLLIVFYSLGRKGRKSYCYFNPEQFRRGSNVRTHIHTYIYIHIALYVLVYADWGGDRFDLHVIVFYRN